MVISAGKQMKQLANTKRFSICRLRNDQKVLVWCIIHTSEQIGTAMIIDQLMMFLQKEDNCLRKACKINDSGPDITGRKRDERLQ